MKHSASLSRRELSSPPVEIMVVKSNQRNRPRTSSIKILVEARDEKAPAPLVREPPTITRLEVAVLSSVIGLVLIAIIHSFGVRGTPQAAVPGLTKVEHGADTITAEQTSSIR